MKATRRSILFTTFLLFTTAFAQTDEFGKNKIQYKSFEWYFIQSKHFDVYFYPQEYYLAEFAAETAEKSYNSISQDFHYEINNRIPLVVYSSHNDWQQTNVVSEYLEEGIGGVTELFKNRVVVPFEGSYYLFRHVIHHELVHAVINDMLYGGSVQSMIANNITLQVPMWLNEGLAEYESLRWDTNSDMFMLDATISENLVPVDRLYGYFAYRGGQSVLWYIANKYGNEKIGEIISRIRTTRSVEQGFKSALGIGLKELSKRWMHEQKVEYWPQIALRKRPEDFAKRLTDHEEIGTFYNTSPAVSPQGDKVAFISDRDDYFSIFIMNASDGSEVMKLVDGQKSKNFEELHLLTPGLTWSPDGNKIAVAVKSGSHDAIYLIDVKSREMQKLEFKRLEGLFSVSWSPDGERLAFVGDNSRQSDVFVYDLKNKNLANLTNDVFSDSDPSWSPDGKSLFFVSDCGAFLDSRELPKDFRIWNHDFLHSHIYSIDIATSITRKITDSEYADETYPVAAPDGRHLYYVSNKSGITNLYYMDLETDSSRPVTNSLSGIYQISLTKDGSELAFSALENGGFDIFLLRNPGGHVLNESQVPLTPFMRKRVVESSVPSAKADLSGRRLSSSRDSVSSKEQAKDLYGKDVQVDLSGYVFGRSYNVDSLFTTPSLNGNFKIENNTDSSGNFIAQKYRVNFTPDIVYGNAGYNTFFGVQGSTILAFSDMLGNNQLILLTDLMVDLKNSDYGFEYDYLPLRVSLSLQGSHFARFLYLTSPLTGYYDLYRFQSYGISLRASYPLDRFSRVESGLSWMGLSRENLDQPAEPVQDRTLIVPSLRYVHDNSFFGYIAPINGARYYAYLFGTPKFGRDGISFVSGIVDYRDYLKLFGTFYTFAWRVFAGTSTGSNPQKFFIGGTENWINATFQGDFLPVRNVEDLAFLTPVVPMRGYNYSSEFGNNFALVNMELRFPMLGFLAAGPVPLLQTFFGNAFLDVGSAWGYDWYNNYKKFQAFDHDSQGNLKTRDLLIGTGVGARMVVLYFLLRLDIAWAYNIRHFSPPRYYFSLGYDF